MAFSPIPGMDYSDHVHDQAAFRFKSHLLRVLVEQYKCSTKRSISQPYCFCIQPISAPCKNVFHLVARGQLFVAIARLFAFCHIVWSRVSMLFLSFPAMECLVSCHHNHCYCRFDINVAFRKICWVCALKCLVYTCPRVQSHACRFHLSGIRSSQLGQTNTTNWKLQREATENSKNKFVE